MKGVWDKVNSGLNFLFGIAGIIMVLVASYAVLARNVLLVSTPWSDELLKLIFIWTIYMGSAVLFMNDELISLTLLEDKYKESKGLRYFESNSVCSGCRNQCASDITVVYDCKYADEYR